MAARIVLIAFLTGVFQTAQPRPATLQGHVIRAGSSAPVAHARVVIAKVGGTLADYRTLTTGAGGQFAVSGISAGTYRAYATHDGYLQGEFGRRGVVPGGVPIAIAEGETSPDLQIALTPASVITGHVTRRGEPVANVWVRALKGRYSGGERTFTAVDWAQTDDRGEYRLFGLAPGVYFVSATPRARPWIDGESIMVPTVATNANGNRVTERRPLAFENVEAAIFDPDVYPAVYHPGTIDAASAQPIDIAPGAIVVGIDFSLTPAETFRVRGHAAIVDDGGASRPIAVDLQSADSSGALPQTRTRPDGSGAFEFVRVPPGRYYVTAQTSDSEAPHMYDSARVDVVDQAPPIVTLTLRRGVTVTGRVTVDGSAPGDGAPPILLQLQGTGGRGGCCGAVRVQGDGSFAIDNVPAREFRMRVSQTGRSPWIRSARFGGVDVTSEPLRIGTDVKGRDLEIDLGTRTATVDLLVVDNDQQPMSGALVVARAADPAGGFVARTSGADGHARIPGLAPGEYMLFASDSIAPDDWQDPVTVQRVDARGTRAELHEGETKAITLRIIQ